MKSQEKESRKRRQVKSRIVKVADIITAISEMFSKEEMQFVEKKDMSDSEKFSEWHRRSIRIAEIWEEGLKLLRNSKEEWIAQVYKIANPKIIEFVSQNEQNWNNRGWTAEQAFNFIYDCCIGVEGNLSFFDYETTRGTPIVPPRSDLEQFLSVKKTLKEERVSRMVNLKIEILQEALDRALGVLPSLSRALLKKNNELMKWTKFDKKKHDWDSIYGRAYELWESSDRKLSWMTVLRNAVKIIDNTGHYDIDVHGKFYKNFLRFKDKKLKEQ